MRKQLLWLAVAFVAACDGSAAPPTGPVGPSSAGDGSGNSGATPGGSGGTTGSGPTSGGGGSGGGSGSDCPTQVTRLASDANIPGPLAVDATSLYWAELRGDHASIMRMPKAGGPSSVVTSDDLDASAPVYGIAGLAVDGDGIYWSSYSYDSVLDVGSGGRAMLLAYHFATGGTVALDAATSPIRDLVVDAGTIFFSNDDAVWSVPTGGGAPHRIATPLPPGKLTVDAWHIFLAGGGSLYRIDRLTGAVETLATFRTSDLAVAVDFQSAFVADAYGQVWAVDAPGQSRRIFLVADGSGQPVTPFIRLADDQIYWRAPGNALMRIAIDASSIDHFLGATPTDAVVDGDRLYYSQNDEVDVVCR